MTTRASPVRLFWWAPRRSLRLLAPEVRANPSAWVRLMRGPGRPLTNFGDEMSVMTVKLATGRRVVWSSPAKADLVAIGSVLELCFYEGFRGQIWGSGLRHGSGNWSAPDHLTERVLAVRGPKTRDALGLGDSVPLGDPGLLAASLLGPGRSGPRRKLFVPHFRTWASPEGLDSIRHLHRQGFEVASPTLKPKDLIRKVAGASMLVTSSLHGLIVAHSLGTPVQLVTVGRRLDQEPDFKFEDHVAAIGVSHVPIEWSAVNGSTEFNTLMDIRAAEASSIVKRAESLSEGLLTASENLKS